MRSRLERGEESTWCPWDRWMCCRSVKASEPAPEGLQATKQKQNSVQRPVEDKARDIKHSYGCREKQGKGGLEQHERNGGGGGDAPRSEGLTRSSVSGWRLARAALFSLSLEISSSSPSARPTSPGPDMQHHCKAKTNIYIYVFGLLGSGVETRVQTSWYVRCDATLKAAQVMDGSLISYFKLSWAP